MQAREGEQTVAVTPTSVGSGSTARLRSALGAVLGHRPTSVKWGRCFQSLNGFWECRDY